MLSDYLPYVYNYNRDFKEYLGSGKVSLYEYAD